MADHRPRLGISACLLGETVRYDGGHQRDEGVVALAHDFHLLPACPEAGAGLGVPREPMHRQGDQRVVTNTSRQDLTPLLRAWCCRQAAAWKQAGVRGCILKARSPSCGVRDTLLFDPQGNRVGLGSGIFTLVLQAAQPALVLITSEALADPRTRQQFLEQVCQKPVY